MTTSIRNDPDKINMDMSGKFTGTQNKPVAFTEPVPDFHFEISQKKWGKIKTEVIRVNCTMEDAELLKTRISVISELNKLTKGMFVPVGIHLMTSADTMTNILQQHEKYLQTMRGIPITNVHYGRKYRHIQ